MRTQINNTLLFAVCIFFGLSTSLYGQNPGTSLKPDFKTARFGFRVSPNYNWVKIMEGRMSNNGGALGFSYGVMGDFNIGGNPSYWLSTELIVTSLPGKIMALDTLYNTSALPSGAPFTDVEFDYRLQYIQIPIGLKLKTEEIGNLSYWVQFGVSPALLLQNKVTTSSKEQLYKSGENSHSPNKKSNDPLDFEGVTNNNTTTGKFIDNVSPLRISMVIGAGVEFKISGKTSAIAGLRFDNGFTDMFRDGAVTGRNNYLGIMAGIFF